MTQCIVQYQTRTLVQMTFKGQCSLLRIILVMIYVCYCQQISIKDQKTANDDPNKYSLCCQCLILLLILVPEL